MQRRPIVNKERFLKNFVELARFGATLEGLNREAGSVAFFEARDFLKKLMEKNSLATRVDAAGNLFGVLEGRDFAKKNRRILSGSHLDSVPNGGIYDGPLGIVAAIEAVCAIRESGYENNHSLEIVAFNAEEGGPLGGTFGSRVFAGVLRHGDVPDDVLARYGMHIDALLNAKINPGDYRASIELHIEQGPVLWKEKLQIGIPTGIVGISRHSVRITGVANHAGTTPIKDRKDAMQDAARMIGDWYAWVAACNAKEDFVCNIGTFNLFPGHVSIVPGKVEFMLELRALDSDNIHEAADKFIAIAEAQYNCEVVVEALGEKPSVALDDSITSMICGVCDDCGLSYRKMPSGASHDSSPIAKIMPAGMIFIPSVEGISHAKEEFTLEEDMFCGVECLLGTLLRIDKS